MFVRLLSSFAGNGEKIYPVNIHENAPDFKENQAVFRVFARA